MVLVPRASRREWKVDGRARLHRETSEKKVLTDLYHIPSEY